MRDAATYVHHPGKQIGTVLATSAGTTASTGTWAYYFQDAIGSTRGLWDEEADRIGKYDYTPFGGKYSDSGEDITRKFTGHDWDSAARLYYTAYRYYSPDANRWLTRDPLGMVDGPNVYAYVVGNPIRFADPMGADLIDWVLTGSWDPADDIAQAAYAAFWNELANPRECAGSFEECYSFCVDNSGVSNLNWALEHTLQVLGFGAIVGYDYYMMTVMRSAYSIAMVNLLSGMEMVNAGAFSMAEWETALIRLENRLAAAGRFRTGAALSTAVYVAATFELSRRATCVARCSL